MFKQVVYDLIVLGSSIRLISLGRSAGYDLISVELELNSAMDIMRFII